MRSVAALVLLIAVLGATTAHACSCMNPGTTADARVQSALKTDKHVLRAQISNVVSYTVVGDGTNTMTRTYQNATITVMSDYKGSLNSTTIRTSTDTTCCMCGLSITAGSWIITPYGSDATGYSLSMCSISCKLNNGDSLCEAVAARLGGSANTAAHFGVWMTLALAVGLYVFVG